MNHELYMRRALELAQHASSAVEPNPYVGCVIVADNHIISEGFHERFGENHAEINALQRSTASCKNATMYVTLEPCSHTGKTPPCVDAIIAAGISHVVIGATDPNPLVSGKGIQLLQGAGIQVTVGVLAEECLWLIRHFTHYITQPTPYVTVKIAQSLDGYIATSTRRSQWISGILSRTKAHELRAQHSAIMVGVGTVIADDPELTVRHVEGTNPHRIILDAKCRMLPNSNIVQSATLAPCTVYCLEEFADSERAHILRAQQVQVVGISGDDQRVHMPAVLKHLHNAGTASVLCEGGGNIISSLFQLSCVQELHTFTAPIIFGGGVQWIQAVSDDPEESLRLRLHSFELLDSDIHATYVF